MQSTNTIIYKYWRDKRRCLTHEVQHKHCLVIIRTVKKIVESLQTDEPNRTEVKITESYYTNGSRIESNSK